MCSVSKIVISPEEYFNFTLLEDDTYSIVAKDVENMPSEVIIPATYNGKAVTEIYYNAFLSLDGDHSFVIPDSITSIDIGCATMHPFIFSGNIIKIEVSEDNATYKSIDGCLYTKDGKILLVYATGKSDQTYTLPQDVEIINYGAFYKAYNLQNIIIPKNVKTIFDLAFYLCKNLTSIYYEGTDDLWSNISIGDLNEPLVEATRYYYSKSQPTTEGNFWHWIDGEPVAW